MKYKVGRAYYFYNNDAVDDVCKAHVLHIMPHPEADGVFLIVYRWYGKHQQWWHYKVTDTDEQDMWSIFVNKVLKRRKDIRNEQKNQKEVRGH